MEIGLVKLGEHCVVMIDGALIENIKDYELKSSANGKTELTIKIECHVTKVELSTKKQ